MSDQAEGSEGRPDRRRRKVAVLATRKQAQAVRHLIDLIEKHAPRGDGTRMFMWRQIAMAQSLVYNIDMAMLADLKEEQDRNTASAADSTTTDLSATDSVGAQPVQYLSKEEAA